MGRLAMYSAEKNIYRHIDCINTADSRKVSFEQTNKDGEWSTFSVLLYIHRRSQWDFIYVCPHPGMCTALVYYLLHVQHGIKGVALIQSHWQHIYIFIFEQITFSPSFFYYNIFNVLCITSWRKRERQSMDICGVFCTFHSAIRCEKCIKVNNIYSFKWIPLVYQQ